MFLIRRFLAPLAGLLLIIQLQADDRAPEDLAQWGTVCFCIKALKVPQTPLRLDNNGRILYAAKDGATRDQLAERGAVATDSQLYLLQNFGLLKKQGEIYRTSFPILGPEIMSGLRGNLSTLAKELSPKIQTDVAAIADELKRGGFREHVYAVVFSYVLDGLIWDQLQARSALPSVELTPEHPLWNGAFWAFYPKQASSFGTNELKEGGITLQMTWSDRVLPSLRALTSSPELKRFLQNVSEARATDSPLRDERGTEWSFFNDGRLSIPVIHPKAGDIVHDAGNRIAAQMAEALVGTELARAARALIPNATEPQATLILAHEFMWLLRDELVSATVIQPPPVLQPAGELSATNLRALVYLIDSR